MRLDIYLYGDEVLRRRAGEVERVTPEIRELVENMLETMYSGDGLGLAAPQVGVSLRVVVIDVPHEGSGKLMLVNPVILEAAGSAMMDEGCLSFPDIVVPVQRATEVTFEYTTLGGKKRTRKASGVTAQAVQHEIDHLDGKLLVDRMSAARKALFAGKLRRLRKRGEKGERR
jgi:peptide deformylase